MSIDASQRATELSGDELLRLSRSGLLDWLVNLRGAAATARLREGITKLRAAVAGGALVSSGEHDLVELPSEYLFAELAQIVAAQTLERAHYYLDRLTRAVGEERAGTGNDLNLNRWKTYNDIITDSLWLVERRDGSGVHNAGYWGNFIPQIPYQLMRRYTRRGDWVIDAFTGLGTTQIEAQRLGRHCLGVELQPEVAEQARQQVSAEPNPHGVTQQIDVGDSASIDYQELLARQGRDNAQLVILHPPYFDIIHFSDDPRDLSNAPTVDNFLEKLGTIVEHTAAVLERGRHLALVIGDKYSRGEWIPLGFLAMNEALKHQLTLKSIVVKNFDATAGKRQQKELWRYRALVGGFYIFKHEYMFIFKKR